MISHKAKYALRALIALARAQERDAMQISDIAREQAIPKKFLEQILLDLKHHGLLSSRRGKFGGYRLLKEPDQITFGHVLRIIDGPIAPLSCLSQTAYRPCDDCIGEADCEIRRTFRKVADVTRDILDRWTLADALAAKADPIPLPGIGGEGRRQDRTPM